MNSKGLTFRTICLLAGILFLAVGLVQAAPSKVPPVSLGPKTLLGDGTPPTAYEFFLQPGSSWKGDIGGIVAGKTYSLVILDIDVTAVTGPAGRQIYFNLQDAESGSSFKNLGINVVLQAAGSGGPALFQAYQQFTSEGLSSHGLNAGELTESDFDLRFDFTKASAGLGWTVTPYFRLSGGSWTLFFDGPFVGTVPFDFLGAKLVVAFDWGADGTVSFNNYYLKGPASTVYVDDNWVGLTEGTAVQFPGQTDYRTIGVDAFATIQAGVNNVTGSTVNVAAGTYNEQVGINKDNLTIIGNPDPYSTWTVANTRTVDAGGIAGSQTDGFNVLADGVTIKGFRFINSDQIDPNVPVEINSAGVMVGSWDPGMDNPPGTIPVDGTTVQNCVVEYYTYGVYIYGSRNTTVRDSEFKNARNKDWPSGGDAVMAWTDNGPGHDYNTGTQILNNVIHDNAAKGIVFGSWAPTVIPDFSGAVVSGNEIYNHPSVGIDIMYADFSSDPLSITGNNIYLNRRGIRLYTDVSGVEAHYNNIYDNTEYGAQLPYLTSVLNAENNWWGAASGPYHGTTNPTGTGDPITDNVSYSPWLGEPVPTIAPVAYHVNPTGTIQEAIDYASPGDSVLVHPGTYTSDDVVADIYKAITVQSTGGASVTFIQKTPHPMGWGDGAVRLRDANGITFDGFTVRNSATANEGAGILIGAPFAGSNDHRSNNNTVKNCVVDNASIGIYLYETSGDTIQSNEVFGMRDEPAGSFGVGIILWDDEPTGTSHNTNNTITGNNVHDCDRFGFALGGWGAPADRFDVTGTSITNNVFTNNYCNPACQSLGFMFATGLLTLSGNVITPSTEKEFFFSNTEILDSVKVNGDYFWTPDWLNPFSIQEAIYTVIPGGTVVVEAGTYVEDITIGKSLTLIGAGVGKGLTLVKPGTDQAYVPPPTNSGVTVINVTANNVTIKDLEVDGTMTAGDPGQRTNMAKRGIYGSSVDNFRVEGCKVVRCVSGIVGVLSSNLNFHGNTLDDCGHSFNVGGGIYLWGSSGDVGTLAKPNVLTNIVDCGIMYHASSSGNAMYNQLTDCELGMLVNGNNNPTIFDHNDIHGSSMYGGIQVVHPGAAVTISSNNVLCNYDALEVFNTGTNTVTVTDNHFYYTSTKGSEDQMHYRIPWIGEEYSGKMAYTLLNDKSGESGIYLSTESTYGDGPVYATITGNIIAGYDYDVRCHERSGDPSQLMDVDANGGAGINFFYGYGTYAWYMDNCNDDINATYNYWGKSLVSQIEQGIYHQVDNPALGLVDFSMPYLLGDVNIDRVINVVDVVYLINYIYINGPPPYLLILGDTNRDGQIDIEDVITLINYLFLSGPPPIVSEEK